MATDKSIKRFPDGRAKPYLSPAEYAELRDDDRFLYNEGTSPSARITGDKGRENPAEGASTDKWFATENQRLRTALQWIADAAYVDHVSGNDNFEYLQQCAEGALKANSPQALAQNERKPDAE